MARRKRQALSRIANLNGGDSCPPEKRCKTSLELLEEVLTGKENQSVRYNNY
jgi:hypothetical protein